jgi:hypothetical protein
MWLCRVAEEKEELEEGGREHSIVWRGSSFSRCEYQSSSSI